VGGGERGDRTVEGISLAQVGGDGDPVAPAGVRASERRAADARVQGSAGYEHAVDVGAALPIVKLPNVVVAGFAVEPFDADPTQEDVGRGLHQPLAGHHSLSVVWVGALPQEAFQYGGLRLLDLQEQ